MLSRVRLCNPMGCSPPGSSVRGLLQARTLEWAAISFSRGSSRPRDGALPPKSPALQVDALPPCHLERRASGEGKRG